MVIITLQRCEASATDVDAEADVQITSNTVHADEAVHIAVARANL